MFYVRIVPRDLLPIELRRRELYPTNNDTLVIKLTRQQAHELGYALEAAVAEIDEEPGRIARGEAKSEWIKW